jgi:hypothetical protein
MLSKIDNVVAVAMNESLPVVLVVPAELNKEPDTSTPEVSGKY